MFKKTSNFLLILLLVLFIPFLYLNVRYDKEIESNPEIEYAIVFGAGVLQNGEPSRVLKNRLDKSIDGLNNNFYSKILVSGYNDIGYSETTSMYDYLVDNGVEASAILVDPNAARTSDTCSNAVEDFGITNTYLITQAYHIPRASHYCLKKGITTTPLRAEDVTSGSAFSSSLREVAASWLTILEVGF